MIETITLVTLCMLFLIFFRPGKTPPLEKSLVIERPGQYHLTLAPQLNLAQTFLETLAGRILASAPQNTGTHFFEVRDKQVVARGFDCYLLAITAREGRLYIQAVSPSEGGQGNYLQTISECAHVVLARIPDDEAHASGEGIVREVQSVAAQCGIQVRALSD
jgi:hypothetical protein